MKASDLFRRAVMAGAAVLLPMSPTAAQDTPAEVHAAKRIYAEGASNAWTTVAPGQVTLTKFTPFRAVYERYYVDHKGSPRKDRVIITAEHVAWGHQAAIMVGLIDSGSLDYDDTSARSQVRYFAADDLTLLLQLTPTSGTAKDYTLFRTEGDVAHMTRVKTATGESEHREQPIPAPGFGAPGSWLFASMSLEAGMMIRLEPYYAVASSNVFGAEPSRVVGREWIDAADIGRQNAWVLERPLGMTSPRLMHSYLIDRPPYFLGKRVFDADTERPAERWSMRLLEFQAFPGRSK